ncbi:hypothetical protein B9G69_002890 [Bdellovibrio sp. SKB1291214]|uniref:hypothetical protein n=1 Tax=Bdellovibrio sp. SKB1291214 TaxID=1732569 RepID=UPI000B518FF2|nr:hypothetical protein [Bdellovibrio sp. SKB1291214]UYL09519.1 hypothetical protein B9G69_002890 [Bdellovibrio sp. SKB1291214]
MQRLFKVIFTVLSFSCAAQAMEINILQPNYRCQSKEFIPDNNMQVTVLQDRVSGMNHIEIAQSWIGGIRTAYFEVSERVEKNGNNQPVIFEGSGIKLSIDQITATIAQHPLQAVLVIPVGEGEIRTEPLICESLL